MWDKYVRPKSVTWWASVALVVYGILSKQPERVLEGLGGIGLRGALPAP